MDNKKFKKPDQAALNRMTANSVNALLDTLREQRAAKVKDIDEEIKFYENLLEEKFGKASA